MFKRLVKKIDDHFFLVCCLTALLPLLGLAIAASREAEIRDTVIFFTFAIIASFPLGGVLWVLTIFIGFMFSLVSDGISEKSPGYIIPILWICAGLWIFLRSIFKFV